MARTLAGQNIPAGPSLEEPRFDAPFAARFRELLVWRRDVRRFRRDPVPPELVAGLFELARLAPSVGLSEPWRFVLVEDPARRAALRANFAGANAAALADQSGRAAARYAALKLAGLEEAPVQFALFVDRGTEQGHGLGRRTMPETADYSAVAALHTLWLAARIEGLGLGWVSILDPAPLNRLLDVPDDWRFIGWFCLGWPSEAADEPALQRAGWERRAESDSKILHR